MARAIALAELDVQALAVPCQGQMGGKAMAKPRGPAHVAGITRVDPEIDIRESFGPIDAHGGLAGRGIGQDSDSQSLRIPGDPHRGPRRAAIERRRDRAEHMRREDRAARRAIRAAGISSIRGQNVLSRNQKAWGKSILPIVQHSRITEPHAHSSVESTNGLGLENGLGLIRAPMIVLTPSPISRKTRLYRARAQTPMNADQNADCMPYQG